MNKLIKRLKKEVVFVISFVLAVASCFIIKPDKAYLGYIDFKVIGLLFCLMAVVAGLSSINVFKLIALRLIDRASSLKMLIGILLILPFFSAMLITNDVSLITFVPLAIESLRLCKKEDKIIYTVVLQAVFANLGSMLTPMGNPQNLYLYSYYGISSVEFFKITIPIILVSFIMLILCLVPIKRDSLELKKEKNEDIKINKSLLIIYLILGLLSLLAVLISKKAFVFITALIVLSALLIFDRKNFKNIDWFLLLTFGCFFVFVGNASRMMFIKGFIEASIKGNEFLYSLILSQFISNVPCAVMLSAFCDNYKALILGVNVGGLGTLVASLASLIAFRLYAKYERANKGKFLAYFTVINLIFLLILSAICSIIMNKYFL